MKTVFSIILSLIITSTTVRAQKPTSQQITSLIKQNYNKDFEIEFGSLFGLPFSSKGYRFEKVQFISLKLSKIGKAQSNYYEQSGDYIDSYFYVKALLKGSAVLREPICLVGSKFGFNSKNRTTKCGSQKNIDGKLPIKEDVEHKFLISTDEYGDWYATYQGLASRGKYTSSEDKLNEIYKNIHKVEIEQEENAKKQLKKDELERKKNIQKIRQDIVQINKDAEKKYDDSKNGRIASMVTIKNKLSKKEDLKVYNDIEKKCKEEDWYWVCGQNISNFKNFYFPLIRAQEKDKGKIVKSLEFPSMVDIKYRRKGFSFTESEINEIEKSSKILLDFLDKHPNVKKKYNSSDLDTTYKLNFLQQINNQKTAEAKYLVFLELSKEILK